MLTATFPWLLFLDVSLNSLNCLAFLDQLCYLVFKSSSYLVVFAFFCLQSSKFTSVFLFSKLLTYHNNIQTAAINRQVTETYHFVSPFG